MNSPHSEIRRLRDEVARCEQRCAAAEQAIERFAARMEQAGREIHEVLPRLMQDHDDEFARVQEAKQRLVAAEQQADLNPAYPHATNRDTTCLTANSAASTRSRPVRSPLRDASGILSAPAIRRRPPPSISHRPDR